MDPCCDRLLLAGLAAHAQVALRLQPSTAWDPMPPSTAWIPSHLGLHHPCHLCRVESLLTLGSSPALAGGHLWDASVLMAAWLAECGRELLPPVELQQGRLPRMLELGSGIGVTCGGRDSNFRPYNIPHNIWFPLKQPRTDQHRAPGGARSLT